MRLTHVAEFGGSVVVAEADVLHCIGDDHLDVGVLQDGVLELAPLDPGLQLCRVLADQCTEEVTNKRDCGGEDRYALCERLVARAIQCRCCDVLPD